VRQVGTQPVGCRRSEIYVAAKLRSQTPGRSAALGRSAPVDLIAREIGVSEGPIYDWLKQYKTHGEEGLQPKSSGVKAGYKHPVQSPMRD